MLTLLQTFLEIALWRKGPQDLPASRALALTVLATYVLIGFARVSLFDLNLRAAMVNIGVDVLMLGAWLYAVLAFFGRRQRFVQTMTATLGVGVLMQLLDTMVLILDQGDAHSENWLFIRFVLVALIMGRILMHALERGLATGIALTIAIVHSTHAISQLMLESLKAS